MPSLAKLRHFNFWARTGLKIFLSISTKFSNFERVSFSNQFYDNFHVSKNKNQNSNLFSAVFQFWAERKRSQAKSSRAENLSTRLWLITSIHYAKKKRPVICWRNVGMVPYIVMWAQNKPIKGDIMQVLHTTSSVASKLPCYFMLYWIISVMKFLALLISKIY